MTTQPTVVIWFREDLRLSDHQALTAAVDSGARVLPVYVLDEAGDWPWGGASRWYLHASLTSLQAGLRALGAELMLCRGDPAEILAALMDATGAVALHAGRSHTPQGRRAEASLAGRLGDRLRLHRTMTLFDPETIKTGTGGVYGVYTPFARACRARGGVGEPLPAPGRLQAAAPPWSDALADWGLLPTRPDWAAGMRETWTAGEAAAQARLGRFFEAALEKYKTGRNLPGQDGTSRLSASLHWGEISARQVWCSAGSLPAGDGLETYLGEILWREFAAYLLWHHPDLPAAPMKPAFAKLPLRHQTEALDAWQRGRTGVPIVDAGMRQLWRLGWMHNRVRMITASFLVKNLLIDWREGERWFWDTLVDADLATNAASWQWIAGCGTDSQPFFRIFNPVTQGETWDKTGTYVRDWVPELARLDDRWLHAPWTAPVAELRRAGIRLGQEYPAPMVELAASRQRALEAYRAAVGSKMTQEVA